MEEKTERERTEEREGEKTSNFSLRSTEVRWSVFVGPRTKVHRVDERYAWVFEKRDFAEDPSGGDFGKSRLSGL